MKTCINEAIMATEKMSCQVSHSSKPESVFNLRHREAQIASYQLDTAHQPLSAAMCMPRADLVFVGLDTYSPARTQDDECTQ